jgi:hypothetical protein
MVEGRADGWVPPCHRCRVRGEGRIDDDAAGGARGGSVLEVEGDAVGEPKRRGCVTVRGHACSRSQHRAVHFRMTFSFLFFRKAIMNTLNCY